MREEWGCTSILVLLEPFAAFSTIGHGILLYWLKGFGVGYEVLNLFAYFFQSQFQLVLIWEVRSCPQPSPCGVLQGLVLSSFLFNIYMKLCEKAYSLP